MYNKTHRTIICAIQRGSQLEFQCTKFGHMKRNILHTGNWTQLYAHFIYSTSESAPLSRTQNFKPLRDRNFPYSLGIHKILLNHNEVHMEQWFFTPSTWTQFSSVTNFFNAKLTLTSHAPKSQNVKKSKFSAVLTYEKKFAYQLEASRVFYEVMYIKQQTILPTISTSNLEAKLSTPRGARDGRVGHEVQEPETTTTRKQW